MPDHVYRPHVGVHLILIEQGKVLLLQRANTGFADGSWSVPGGRLDKGETLPAGAAREGHEELGITIHPGDLAFAHLCHHTDPDGQARIGVFFTATRWSGQPTNAEPAKCSKIDWFDLDALPDDLVSYARGGIQAHRRGQTFSLDNWPEQAVQQADEGPSAVRTCRAWTAYKRRASSAASSPT